MSIGKLFVVATPIGNLLDISERALTTLRGVQMIAAEDTRRTKVLLERYGIHVPLTSCHAHNEVRVVRTLLKRIEAGEDVALVSDAGTPLLSDPGRLLVEAAHRLGATVTPIPGPSAITAALSAAGFPADQFVFVGFLPRSGSDRSRRLQTIAEDTRTSVVFEATNRLSATLDDLIAVCGVAREAAIAREISKQFESVRRGTLLDLRDRYAKGEEESLGEAVIVVSPSDRPQRREPLPARAVVALLREHLPPGQASRLAAKITGLSRDDAYALTQAEADPADQIEQADP